MNVAKYATNPVGAHESGLIGETLSSLQLAALYRHGVGRR